MRLSKKELIRMMIHVRKILNFKMSFKCHCQWLSMYPVIVENFENSLYQVSFSDILKIITITVTKIVLIQRFFLLLPLKKQKCKHEIPWNINIIQKSALLKTRESHFFVVWVILSIISLCLGKVNVFPIILAWQS